MMYKLSPSDFKYLWEDCKHCYYQKVKFGITLPSIGMPGVFMKMNSLLQDSIMGMDLRKINPDLPAGKVEVKEGFLRSIVVPPSNKCYISGRFDFVSKLDDGTYSVIDFKITDPNEDKLQKFSSQLHAYKFALEHPSVGKPRKVSRMGVVAVTPQSIKFEKGGVVFKSTPKWHEIKEDMDGFFDFVTQVSKLLDGPVPQVSESCLWCRYRLCFMKTDGHEHEETQEEMPF